MILWLLRNIINITQVGGETFVEWLAFKKLNFTLTLTYKCPEPWLWWSGRAGCFVVCRYLRWAEPHTSIGYSLGRAETYMVITGIQWADQERETYFHWRSESRWISQLLSPSRYFCWSAPGLPQRSGCQLLGTPGTHSCTCLGSGPRCSQSWEQKCRERRKRTVRAVSLRKRGVFNLSIKHHG